MSVHNSNRLERIISNSYSANYFIGNAVYRILHHYMEDVLIWEIVGNDIIYYIMYYNIM